ASAARGSSSCAATSASSGCCGSRAWTRGSSWSTTRRRSPAPPRASNGRFHLEPHAGGLTPLHAPARGKPVHQVQPPAARLELRGVPRRGLEPPAAVPHLGPDDVVGDRDGEPDLDVGWCAGVTDGGGHYLAHLHAD